MFYIEDENKNIVLFNEIKQNIINTLEFMPQYKDLPILETDRKIVVLPINEKTNKFVFEDEHQAEIEVIEKDRISHLKCTKRVFALGLQDYGLTYTKLKELIATNEQAQLEWDLCVELERSNPLLDIMGAELGITPIQLDNIFRLANGEVIDENTTDTDTTIIPDEVPTKGN